MTREIPPLFETYLRSWDRSATWLGWAYLTLWITAMVAALFVAVFACYIGDLYTRGAALIAAIATVMLPKIGDRQARFREAWRMLNAKIIAFKFTNDPDCALESVLAAYQAAEAHLGVWSRAGEGAANRSG